MIDYTYIDVLYTNKASREHSNGLFWHITLAAWRKTFVEHGFTSRPEKGHYRVMRKLRTTRYWTDDNFRVDLIANRGVAKTHKAVKERKPRIDANGTRTLTFKQWLIEMNANLTNV